MKWRMEKPCADCPFEDHDAGTHLRKSLGRGRWQSILRSLRGGSNAGYFLCHKTTVETGDGSKLVCAGALAWQEEHGHSSNYVRCAESLEYFSRQRAQRRNG